VHQYDDDYILWIYKKEMIICFCIWPTSEV